MIYEIEHSDYYEVSHLLEHIKDFPEIHVIINKSNPGKIYVDNKESPKTVLVWNQGMQGFYFIGDHNNHSFLRNMKEYINEKILNDLTNKGINWFEISGSSDKWNHVIEELFMDKNIKYGYQLIYKLNKSKFIYDKNLTYSYDIRKVDEHILETEVSNLDFIINELELFWGTINNFLNNGICYYAIEDCKIVSICYTGFKSDKIQTIGIETLKEYRRKGHGYALANKIIEDCNNHNYIPYWDCSEDNIGSKMLAEKLGFEKSGQYRCYWFNF